MCCLSIHRFFSPALTFCCWAQPLSFFHLVGCFGGWFVCVCGGRGASYCIFKFLNFQISLLRLFLCWDLFQAFLSLLMKAFFLMSPEVSLSDNAYIFCYFGVSITGCHFSLSLRSFWFGVWWMNFDWNRTACLLHVLCYEILDRYHLNLSWLPLAPLWQGMKVLSHYCMMGDKHTSCKLDLF